MIAHYKGRYGLSGNDVDNLNCAYNRPLKGNHTFASFDAFVLYAAENGYQKGMHLRRKDEKAPHGPGNTYWSNSHLERAERKVKIAADRGIISPYCKDCDRPCNTFGCPAWREYFVKNWNRNIHWKKPEPKKPEPNKREVFRYEHPDMVREGIVFETSG